MTTERRPLPLRTMLAFGAGDIGPATIAMITGFFLLNFLINVAGLRPGVAGTIFLIAKIWDAVNDPIMGWLTDKTVSKMGRRRPWLLYGAIPLGLAFFLHWVVPPLDATGKFWYYLIVALLLDTAYTAVLVPYAALTPELTPDYDERTRLTAVRMSFSLLGGVLTAFIHGQILAAFANDPIRGNLIAAAIWGVVIAVPFFVTFFGTREPDYATQPKPETELSFWAGLQIAFRNRAFVLVTIIYWLSFMSLQFIQNNLLIYATDWVKMDVGQFSFVMLCIQVSAFIWVLIFGRLSDRLGKQGVYYIGVAVLIAVEIGLFFVQPGQTTLVFILALLAGVGVSVANLIPWSMLPDVIELDELETGQRREGIFYGFFALFQKLGLSLGLFFSGQVLDRAGYINAVPGQAAPIQPDSALFALRLLVGPASAVILVASLVAVYFYPITKAKHAEIRAQIKAKGLPQ